MVEATESKQIFKKRTAEDAGVKIDFSQSKTKVLKVNPSEELKQTSNDKEGLENWEQKQGLLIAKLGR